MKIAVYGICRNEAPFVERFMSTLGEADAVYITDTGSSDGTVGLLRSFGASVVEQRIEPFRFDAARNAALAHVPDEYEVVVSLDLDEVIESGWRRKAEAAFAADNALTCLHYLSVYRRDKAGNAEVSLPMDRIHRRDCYQWKYPVHEMLVFSGTGRSPKCAGCPDIVVNHYPDLARKRVYNSLMDLAVQEFPEDSRMAYYHARELGLAGQVDGSIREYRRYLALTEKQSGGNDATAQFRAMVCRELGRLAVGKGGRMLPWMLRAAGEYPFARENWLWLAKAWMAENNHASAIDACRNALMITRHMGLIGYEEPAWNDEVLKQMIRECSALTSQGV